MPELILSVFRFLRLLLSGSQAVALENAALRLQLAAFRRSRKRPVSTTLDRVFWTTLCRVWHGWRGALIYVQPDTVVRWQRERFRRFWARLSKSNRRRPGRPAITGEIRRLVRQIVAANPLWRAPRIHAELQMIGIAVSERTVSRIFAAFRDLPVRPGRRSCTIIWVRPSRWTSSLCRRSPCECCSCSLSSTTAVGRCCTLRHRPSHGRLDLAADCGGVCRSRRTPIFDPRPRQHLWRRSTVPSDGDGN